MHHVPPATTVAAAAEAAWDQADFLQRMKLAWVLSEEWSTNSEFRTLSSMAMMCHHQSSFDKR